MIRSRLVAALIALFLAALVRSSRAQDAAQAAAAAMQGIGQAGGGAAAGGDPGGRGKKHKDEGGFSRPLTAPQIQKASGGGDADKPDKPAPVKKGRRAKPNASKYKSRDLSESVEHSYRFNENAEALDSAPKKKAAAKAKKKDADDGESKPSCASGGSCPEKNPDADAL
jgi:hypothetical protein